jgi:chromosome segregation ATPase
MYTTRPYNEAYLLTSKKIKEDFQKDEEKETMKYIDDLEQLVSSTKLVLKSLVNGELNYEQLKQRLTEIEQDLTQDCTTLEQEIKILQNTEKAIEANTQELEKQEKEGFATYVKKIEDLKKELEIKEFKIQNMERLYVELENIIKENIKLGNEQLLSLEQFEEFISQNEKLKDECLLLEAEKEKCIEEYNNLLKENINLKSKDESFELEKIKDALEEISSMGNLHKEAEDKINKLQVKYNELNKECEDLTLNIKKITKNLDSLNLENDRLNKELSIVNKELQPKHLKRNNSFSNEQLDRKKGESIFDK